MFDRQISQRDEKGVKHIVEKSWFTKGSKIIVQGIRSGDDFIRKKYSITGGHLLYKIDRVENNGDLVIRSERFVGEEEEE